MSKADRLLQLCEVLSQEEVEDQAQVLISLLRKSEDKLETAAEWLNSKDFQDKDRKKIGQEYKSLAKNLRDLPSWEDILKEVAKK